MKITLKVIPGAKKNLWKDEPLGVKVYLNAPAVEGKANKALVDFLSEHFGVSKARIEIIKGLKSRHKTIMIKGI
jgi:uncharacterized protein (TIGR00251 family)